VRKRYTQPPLTARYFAILLSLILDDLTAPSGRPRIRRALLQFDMKNRKLTIFVANCRREHLAMIEEGRIALFGDHKPTDTLVGVAALTNPDYLLEVDAMAVIDESTPTSFDRDEATSDKGSAESCACVRKIGQFYGWRG
jgi:hypothetical protein